jgi:hypothetical protein
MHLLHSKLSLSLDSFWYSVLNVPDQCLQTRNSLMFIDILLHKRKFLCILSSWTKTVIQLQISRWSYVIYCMVNKFINGFMYVSIIWNSYSSVIFKDEIMHCTEHQTLLKTEYPRRTSCDCVEPWNHVTASYV